MTYREEALDEPLIVAGAGRVQAFDLRDGALRWEHALTMDGITRVASSQRLASVASGASLWMFDRASGALVASHALSFRVSSILARGPVLIAAGTDGMCCFHDGRPVWRIERDGEASWWSGPQGWVRVNAADRGSLRAWAGANGSADLALVLGEVCTQPDT